MGRRAKSTKGKTEPKRAPARKSPKGGGARFRDLEERLAESLEREKTKDRALTEALEQQTATSEILRVISSSPTDARPVFEAILKRAATLCEAQLGHLWLYEGGEQFRLGAGYGSRPDHLQWLQQGLHRFGRPFFRESGPWRVGQVLDVRDTEPYRRGEPVWIRTADHEGMRTLLAVPLVKDGRLIGSIAVYRREVQPFTDQQTALVQTFADQAVIAIENVRLFTELEARNRDLMATSAILQVISSSPANVGPVFDAIVDKAAKLGDGLFSTLISFDGELMRLEAAHNWTSEAFTHLSHGILPAPPSRALPAGRAILGRTVIHLADIELDQDFRHPELPRAVGFRSVLSVPMLRDGVPLGAISVARAEPGPFSDNQIDLLKTFADQAVIAIENVRLFNETKEALEQQTATSDILRAISSSPTEVQPVFDAIINNAARLCGGDYAGVLRLVGSDVHMVADIPTASAEWTARTRANYPHPLTPSVNAGDTAIAEQRIIHIPDLEAEHPFAKARSLARTMGYRGVVYVPMIRAGVALGAIVVTRNESGGFTNEQIGLLKTFADQAVIAIENVRLFKELEARNKELTEALERQTATAEILRVISRSQTEVRPVFAAILECAVRLCGADLGGVGAIEQGQIVVVECYPGTREQWEAVRENYPRPVDTTSHWGRAAVERQVIHVPDVEDPAAPVSLTRLNRMIGIRGALAVPILRGDEPIGVLALQRYTPGPFSDSQIELVQTFADQAVIAIENARLLSELEARTEELTRSVDQLTALGEVGRAVSSTLDLETVLTTIVSRAVELSGLDGGVVFEYDEATEEFVQRVATETAGALAEARRTVRIQKGEGVVGRTALTLEPVQVPDITVPGAHGGRLRDTLIESGVRAVLAVPMVYERRLIGSLGVTRNRPGEFPAETIELLRTFATQSALAIQNARLFREIEDKGRQLEAASQHKSEFLANMSHELRTPLNAIIGFSEVLNERMFGELNEKQAEYLKDIYASGQHLLSLINDILDLSKVEAGRMELEATDFDLPNAIDNALTLVRERATRRGITLRRSIDDRLGRVRGDERKVKQVLLNLLSNALKFTPEGGRIDVSARLQDGAAEIAVADTGVGIAAEDQEAIFEEFRQVGTADKKVEGTGLGLALSRKFIELHGGRIWVQSELGHGSTFTFTLPMS